MTTQRSILIASMIIALAIMFRADDFIIPKAEAEVSGMSYHDLRRDRDFKKAVRYIVENCSVNVNGGYVNGDYIYGVNANISC